MGLSAVCCGREYITITAYIINLIIYRRQWSADWFDSFPISSWLSRKLDILMTIGNYHLLSCLNSYIATTTELLHIYWSICLLILENSTPSALFWLILHQPVHSNLFSQLWSSCGVLFLHTYTSSKDFNLPSATHDWSTATHVFRILPQNELIDQISERLRDNLGLVPRTPFLKEDTSPLYCRHLV